MQSRNWCNYYVTPQLLSPHTCDALLALAPRLPRARAVVGANAGAGRVNRKLRRSTVRWINNDADFAPLFDSLRYALYWYNERHWQMELADFDGGLQFTEYTARDRQHYGWHMDFGSGDFAHRKLSVSVVLSPRGNYEGGNFEFEDINIPPEHRKHLEHVGSALIFPSLYRHRVTPVTRGKRVSLVGWLTGPTYR